MSASAPAGVALSWADRPSLLAPTSSCHLLAAEDGKLLGGRGQMVVAVKSNKLKRTMLPAVQAGGKKRFVKTAID